MANGKRIYYFYDPSLAASTTFIVLYALSAAHHAFLLVKHRTWYFIPFLLGIICKTSSPT
jgi:hypothetical protein